MIRTVAVRLGALCFILVLAPDRARADSADWLREAAAGLRSAQKIPQAITAMQAFWRVTRDAATVCEIGNLAASVQRWPDAVQAYQECAGKPGAPADVRSRLAVARERAEDAEVVAPVRLVDLARRAFASGRRFALKKKWPKAVRWLQAAVVLDAELPGAYRLLGAAYRKMRRSPAAVAAFSEYLRFRPVGPLSDQVRSWLKGKLPLAKLRANASFPCEVWVNNQFVAKKTPMRRLALPSGSYRVTFVSRKYRLVKHVNVDLPAKGTREVSFRFGIMAVRLKPWGRVRANGRDLGLWDDVGLPVGSYRLEVESHKRDRRAKGRWEVVGGKRRTLTWAALKTL